MQFETAAGAGSVETIVAGPATRVTWASSRTPIPLRLA